MNKVEALAALFGSKKALADVIERHPSIVSRWVRRGKVPTDWNTHLMMEAVSYSVDVSAVSACLETACPTCGKPL